MSKIIFVFLGLVLLFAFGCPFEEQPAANGEPEDEGPIDCGRDLGCFADAAKNCTPATVDQHVNFTIFGMITFADGSAELKGIENGSCVLYQLNKDQRVVLTEEMKQSMRDSGATEEEIAETEQKASDNAAKGIGTEVTCRTSTEKMYAVITAWSKSSYSSEDFEGGECEYVYPPALMEMLEPPETEEEPDEVVPEEAQNETAEEPEVPEEEPIVCVPITLTGTAEIAICTEDSFYCDDEGDKQVVYGKEVKIGNTMSLPSGTTVTLEDIVLDAECEECGEPPSWTYSQLAKLRITVPNAADDTVVYADVGDTGTFISGYKCKTLDWDGKTCLEWIPDEENQYYVGKIVANKTCVEHTGEQ
ncbi:MAG: hypothetical protein GY852_03030 [bacterium]|nr:hypothetical protein [bacterium]